MLETFFNIILTSISHRVALDSVIPMSFVKL